MLKSANALSQVNGAIQVGMKFSPTFSRLHTDSNTIFNAFGGDASNSFNLGMLKLWNQYNMLSTPLISMTELEGNVLYTNGFNALLNFQIPYKIGFPKILENICGDKVKPGLGGASFPIVLSENAYVAGDTITYDYREGVELVVQPDEIVPYNGGFKLMVKVATMNEDTDYFPPQALEPGTAFMKISNRSGEKDTNTSALTNLSRTGLMNYAYRTGNSEIGISHWITSYADMLDVNSIKDRPDSQWLSNYSNLNDPKAIMNFYNFAVDANGKEVPLAKGTTWMPSIIAAMQMELAQMKEKDLMWAKGRMISGVGNQSSRVSLGYYQQIKTRGNYIPYTDLRQLPNLLKNIVGELFAGRTDIPYHLRKVKFKMGIGAMQAMQQSFMTQFKTDNPFTMFADHPALKGSITGTYDSISYRPIRVTSVEYPEVGFVEIEHYPVLDFIDIDNENVPYHGMLPNSSYMILVEDLSSQDFSNAMPKSGNYNVEKGYNEGANVVMIKPKNYEDTISFRVGESCSPTLKQFAGISSNSRLTTTDQKGFGVKMYTCGEVYVKDASRVVMLEYRPEGSAFFK